MTKLRLEDQQVVAAIFHMLIASDDLWKNFQNKNEVLEAI